MTEEKPAIIWQRFKGVSVLTCALLSYLIYGSKVCLATPIRFCAVHVSFLSPCTAVYTNPPAYALPCSCCWDATSS
uniref:Uncharacterized protein n=1 Tax=Trichuris muris TaxID=70415 RepID=A0A5S6QKX1_TRIMR